jgi:hypothetical protein
MEPTNVNYYVIRNRANLNLVLDPGARGLNNNGHPVCTDVLSFIIFNYLPF